MAANATQFIRRIRATLSFSEARVDDGSDIERLKSIELGTHENRDNLFGLALSGGGIRSATYALGLLQGVQRTGLLECAHYLSTVSGGGYTGSFWSAWRRHNDGKGDRGDFPVGRDGSEPPEVRHLRRFSNFLSPRLEVFSYDTGRLVVAPIAGALPSLLMALSVIALGLLIWCSIAFLLLTTPAFWSTLTLLLLAGSIAVGFEAAWRMGDGKFEATARNGVYVLLTLIALVVTGVAWSLLGPPGASRHFESVLPRFVPIAVLLYPAGAFGAALLVIIVLRTLAARWLGSASRDTSGTAHGHVRERSAFDRLLSRTLLLVVGWTSISLLWFVGTGLFANVTEVSVPRDVGLFSVLVSALSALFVWARKLISQQPGKTTPGRVGAGVRTQIPRLLASAVVCLIILGLIVALQYWAWHDYLTPVFLGIIVILATGIVVFHPNRIGMHAFYRGRLARSYLGASNPATMDEIVTEEQPSDDFELKQLATLSNPLPVHLICCAANNLTPAEPLLSLQRGAVSAVLSPYGFSVDTRWKTWGDQPSPTIGAAMTASGAAFNSLMGPYSKRFGLSAIFLMSALNLRLGMWLRHPNDPNRESKDYQLPGLLFLSELFGVCSADGPFVHLSDGGHFDNTAAYELVRRRCRYIILADCGADPLFAFDDVGSLIRRVREDFGTEIRIDVAPLVPVDGKARQPMVAGDIHYSDGAVGTLLVFKPTLVGTEPPDVRQYKERNAGFPAESTGDQFYDEAQWESYRRLGEFAAETAFNFALAPTYRNAPAQERVAKVFSMARAEWLPKPADLPERIAHFSQRAAQLDAYISDPAFGDAFQEVYREIATVHKPSPAESEARVESESRIALSLPTVRQAVLFMEETYYSWNLETTYNLPMNLGVMNYFARWAYAEPFRAWWPILKSMYSPQFARFMETQFGLKGIQPSWPDGEWEDVVADVSDGTSVGFARHSWRLHPRADMDRDGERMICYDLRIFFGTESVFKVQAALLRYYKRGGRSQVAYWHASDFFVPPGLWGIGIGEDFLKRIVNGASGELGGVEEFRVLIPRPQQADPAAQKGVADLTQLYRLAGFAEVECSSDDRFTSAVPTAICLAARARGRSRQAGLSGCP